MRNLKELREGLSTALIDHLGLMSSILAEEIIGSVKYRKPPEVSLAELVELRTVLRTKLPPDVDADAVIKRLRL